MEKRRKADEERWCAAFKINTRAAAEHMEGVINGGEECRDECGDAEERRTKCAGKSLLCTRKRGAEQKRHGGKDTRTYTHRWLLLFML